MGDVRKHAMHSPSSSAIWLDCSLHYHMKREAIDAGDTWDTSGEAAIRGTMQHKVMEVALPLYHAGGLTIEEAVRKAVTKSKQKLRAIEYDNCHIALQSITDLIPEGMDFEIELEVPLSYEPESHGSIDVAGYCEDHVLIVDYKFGIGAVSPNASQLKIYAANTLVYLREQGVGFKPDSKVKLAIIQPQLHKEAVVRVFSAAELVKYSSYVDGVVSLQVDGHDRRGAGSLQTCDWCPAKKGCFHRNNLTRSMLSDLTMGSEMPNHVIEEIVKSRGAFKKVIDECVAKVVADKKRFPNWRRAEVPNARKWSPLIEVSKIESQLIDAGVEQLHTLRTPVQIKDDYPDAVKLVDRLTLDQGHHVRLYVGAPKGEPKEEPAKRPKASSRKPAKKSARKKAVNSKKKPARKKAAKKKARKRK